MHPDSHTYMFAKCTHAVPQIKLERDGDRGCFESRCQEPWIHEFEGQVEGSRHVFCEWKGCFVALPTGYGKSLCYQGLPCLFDTLLKHEVPYCIVVVTPLVAIIKDQVL